MAAITISCDFGAQEDSLSVFPLFPHLFAMKWWGRNPWSSFSECWVLSQLFPPRDLPNSGIKPRSPTLQANSLLSKPPGKSKYTVVSSLSLLWGTFLIQNQTGSPGLQADYLPAELWGKLFLHRKLSLFFFFFHIGLLLLSKVWFCFSTLAIPFRRL